jgi:hypothetical protein
MREEADDHLGVTFEAAELAAGEPMQVVDRSGQSVCHGALDERIALLFRIQFGGIRRRIGHRMVLRVRSDEVHDRP